MLSWPSEEKLKWGKKAASPDGGMNDPSFIVIYLVSLNGYDA